MPGVQRETPYFRGWPPACRCRFRTRSSLASRRRAIRGRSSGPGCCREVNWPIRGWQTRELGVRIPQAAPDTGGIHCRTTRRRETGSWASRWGQIQRPG